MVSELPDAAARLRVALRRGRDKPGTIQQVQKAAAELQKTADEASGQNPVGAGVQRVQIEAPAIDVRGVLSWGSASAIVFAGEATLVVFFVFFLLASGDLFKRKLVKLAGPSLEKKKITVHILNEIDSQIEKFLLVRAVTSTVVGVATCLAFRCDRFPSPRRLGYCRGCVQHHSVSRARRDRGGHRGRRLHAVRHDRDGVVRVRRSRW